MRILSPAKINLHLRIGPLASDGFHPLMSWMCTTGLHDMLEFEPAQDDRIELICDQADIPTDPSNLIIRAAEALRNDAGKRLGARIQLRKKIPMGGGLGGGSSNAATTLLALNQVWQLGLSNARLAELSAKLGSDVPFFFHGSSSVCTGRGQHVIPIAPPAAKYAVLALPPISMPTPAVYRRFDDMKLGSLEAITHQPDWASWIGLPAHQLLPLLLNDLETPSFAISPELGKLRGQLEHILGRIVRMSGSGSTLFTLFDNKTEAIAGTEAVLNSGVIAQAVSLAPMGNYTFMAPNVLEQIADNW